MWIYAATWMKDGELGWGNERLQIQKAAQYSFASAKSVEGQRHRIKASPGSRGSAGECGRGLEDAHGWVSFR